MTQESEDYPWWKKTTVFQIYPRSYYDSTLNGIGDLQGIIAKLDYIKEMVTFIAPVVVYPGEDEMEALAMNGRMVMNGEIEPKIYK